MTARNIVIWGLSAIAGASAMAIGSELVEPGSTNWLYWRLYTVAMTLWMAGAWVWLRLRQKAE